MSSDQIEHVNERIQKYLARSGLGSRRYCDELVRRGKIFVNGHRAVLGQRVGAFDEVRFGDILISPSEEIVTYMLNKPAGVLSSASDQRGRLTVVDLVQEKRRIYPLGRLDYWSRGLILVSNDGDLAALITHPAHEIEKEYLVTLRYEVSKKLLRAFNQGVLLHDYKTRPAKKIKKLSQRMLCITLQEGRKRQIRETVAMFNNEVIDLIRVRIGNLRLGGLEPGEYRRLTKEEVLNLKELATRSFLRESGK